MIIGHIWKGVTERGVYAFACQYMVSPRGQTGNRTVTQMRHPLLVEGRPNCVRQSLASTLSAPRVAATSCCAPRSPRKCHYPLFAYPLLKRAQTSQFVHGGLSDHFLLLLIAAKRGGGLGRGGGVTKEGVVRGGGSGAAWVPRGVSSRTKRGIHKRGIHEKVEFPLFWRILRSSF